MTQDLNLQSLRQAAEAAIDQSDAIGEDEWYTASKNLSVFVPNPDLAYIAAASPASILALLDRLERAEARVIELDKASDLAIELMNAANSDAEKAEAELASRSPAGAAVPDTHVVVPKEPTPEMMQAAWDTANALWNTPEADDPLPAHQYRAMLAAALPAPSAQQQGALDLSNDTIDDLAAQYLSIVYEPSEVHRLVHHCLAVAERRAPANQKKD